MVREKGETIPTPSGERFIGHLKEPIRRLMGKLPSWLTRRGPLGEITGERGYVTKDELAEMIRDVKGVKGADELRNRLTGYAEECLKGGTEEQEKARNAIKGEAGKWGEGTKTRARIMAIHDALIPEAVGREKRETRFSKLKFPDLANKLTTATEAVRTGQAGESEYDEAQKDLPDLEEEMDGRTAGLYNVVRDLKADFEAGQDITSDLDWARREARDLQRGRRTREAGRFMGQMVASLEAEVREAERRKLRPEAKNLTMPEAPVEIRGHLMAKTKKGEDLPAVYISQLRTTLKDVELPAKEFRSWTTEEGLVSARVYAADTLAQAVKGGLTELESLILRSTSAPNTIQKETCRYYVRLIEDWVGSSHPVCVDMNTLVEGTLNLLDVYYNTWLPRCGKKHEGIKEILAGVTAKVRTGTLHFFRQDPEIEAATHRIRGEVNNPDFRKGKKNRKVKGYELGDILGGEYGAAEKIAYLVSSLDCHSAHGNYPAVRRANYNALYLRQALDVLGTKGIYDNVRRLFEPICTAFVEEGGRMVKKAWAERKMLKEEEAIIPEGGIVYRSHYGIVPYPDAYHQPSTCTEWIHDNFKEEALGWKNLARMLVIYGDYDLRWREMVGLMEEKREQMGEEEAKRELLKMGFYTIEDWLFAAPEEQKEMYQAAWQRYRESDDESQLTMIRNNLLGIYDYAVKTKGKLVWYYKPLLDFDEQVFDEQDEEWRYIVDIGSLSEENWAGGLGGDVLNEFYTNEEYAWREFSHWQELCDTSMQKQMERFKELLESMTARDCYRHLTEEVEGRPKALVAERRRQIEHIHKAFSENWLVWIWADRREGRRQPGGKKLGWEIGVNERLRTGMDDDRWKKEFESIGLFGFSYLTAYDQQEKYGYQEKVSKLLGKFELKDAWIEYLKGVVELDAALCHYLNFSLEDEVGRQRLLDFAQEKGLIADLEEQEKKGRTWKFYPEKIDEVRTVLFSQANEEDRARIILDELTYRAIVYFAGFKIGKDREEKNQEFLEYDQYGLPVWRTWFDFDFDLDTGKGRGDGEARKAVFDDDKAWGLISRWITEKLDDDEYSPFLYMNEKMEEDNVEGGIGELFFRQTFDKDEKNYVPQRWRKQVRLHKKRWDQYAHMYRDRRYTVGELKGRYVISQLQIEYNPRTFLPRFEDVRTGRMIEARYEEVEGENRVVFKHPRTGRRVVVEFDEITNLPKNTDPDNWIVRLVHKAAHKGEPETPEIAWFYGRERTFPGLYGYDRVGTMVWGTEGVWATRDTSPRQRNKGMGVAGLEKQLTMEWLHYNKNQRLAFFLARYCDPRYIFEVAMNTGLEWEVGQLYQLVADEEQIKEFFDGLVTFVGEDVGWKTDEMGREGVDPGRVIEFSDEKRNFRIAPIEGEVKTGATEEQIINLVELVKKQVKPLAGLIPILRSGNEASCFFRGWFLGEIATGVAAGTALALGASLATPVFIGAVGTAASIWFGTQFLDKGQDEKGREKARGLARVLGSFLRFGKKGTGGLALGMIGQRQRARSPYVLANGWESIWDSALPLKDLLEIWFKIPKEELVRMRVSA